MQAVPLGTLVLSLASYVILLSLVITVSILQMNVILSRSLSLQADERVKTQKKYVIGNHVLAFNPKTFAQVLLYLRNCLAYEAGIKSPNTSSLTDLYDEAPVISKHLQSNYRSPNKGPMASYIGMARQALTALNCKCSIRLSIFFTI